ncbi:MAG: DegT/DnrJ/EryC1/StrS aminotransferase family protein [Spirochaetes bacterium]|nr:DegT/DnrJ/EryC1/StrS aminotransferase family protein [Spirochaetota bacterium]
MAVPLFRPTIKRAEMNRVLNRLVADRIGPGKLADELALLTAQYIGTRGGVTVNSYFTGIKLAFEILGVSEGDRVIASPLIPSVYLEVMKYYGIQPVYSDVMSGSALISHNSLEKLLSGNPKLIILHHTLGFLSDGEKLSSYGIPVIEDISQSLGGKSDGKFCGSFGDVTLMSLEENNALTCGCGAVVMTKSTKILRDLKRKTNEKKEFGRLPDLNASLALSQIRYLEEDMVLREQIAGLYRQAVSKTRHSTLIDENNCRNIHYAYPVVIKNGLHEVERYVRKHNIETAPAFGNSIITEFDGFGDSFPNAAGLSLRTLLFPLYPMLGKGDVDKIARVISTLP